MSAQNFKLDGGKFKNSYMLLIEVHNFEEQLIVIVYFFETAGIFSPKRLKRV